MTLFLGLWIASCLLLIFALLFSLTLHYHKHDFSPKFQANLKRFMKFCLYTAGVCVLLMLAFYKRSPP
jgi:hypothetical protein